MNYWAERALKTQENLTKKNIKETEKQLIKYYENAMSKVIGQFEETYERLLLTVSEGRKVTPADLYKLDKYWKLQGQLRAELEKLGNKTASELSKQFINEYKTIYENIAYKDDIFFGDIDLSTAEQMINQIWCADGQSWSNRVWHNTDKLQQALNDNLIDCVLTGKNPLQLKQMLVDEFNVSFGRADSIVRTEMAHIQTQAARQRYIDMGVSEVEIWADEDERRCDVCGKLHLKKYPVYDVLPIPAHPRCRCTIIPVIDD